MAATTAETPSGVLFYQEKAWQKQQQRHQAVYFCNRKSMAEATVETPSGVLL
jgi:hypothetical protein